MASLPKPSDQQHRPENDTVSFEFLKQHLGPFRFYVVVGTVLFLSGYLGFQLGYQFEQSDRETLQTLKQTVQNLDGENAKLTRELNVMGVELDVQKLANQEAQGAIAEGMGREAQMRERLEFFERIMAPELKDEGFLIDAFDVAQAASEGYFRFDLVLMQQNKVKSVVKGTVTVELEGNLNGEPVRLPLLPMMGETATPITFSFKYFQVIEGVFRLPEGFEPEFIHTSAEIFQFKRKRGDLATRFAWPTALSKANSVE